MKEEVRGDEVSSFAGRLTFSRLKNALAEERKASRRGKLIGCVLSTIEARRGSGTWVNLDVGCESQKGCHESEQQENAADCRESLRGKGLEGRLTIYSPYYFYTTPRSKASGGG